MGARLCQMLLWFALTWPTTSHSFDLDPEVTREEPFLRKRLEDSEEVCLKVHPYARDYVKRFYAILPYFDKEHANTAFLHKFRGTVYAMAQGEDLLDREASFYSAVLTPVIFLQQYRDTWCLLERFHRALRLYQISHPTEKRSALKILQNLRSITQKVRTFILAMQGPPVTRTTHAIIADDDDYHDPKDSRYFKELIRSLG